MKRVATIAQIVVWELIRRKDYYIICILLIAMLVGMVVLNISGLGGVVGYIKDIGLLAIWLLSWILAINLTSRQLPREEQLGTIFPLLAKPVRRWELLTGKWLGCWASTSLATLSLYVILWFAILIQGGSFQTIVLAQSYLLQCASISIVVSLSLALSTRMNHDAAATLSYAIAFLSYFSLPHLSALGTTLSDWRGVLVQITYFILPHLEIFDMRRRLVHDWGAIAVGPLLLVLFYGMIVTVFFLFLAWISYRRKKFVRGRIL